jgi:hypothetical protein
LRAAPQDPDAQRVGFVRVGDTVATLHNSSSNFARCQLKRTDGLVGWTHAYAPGGQRVLNARDPGTKRIAAIPIEGLSWQVVSKKELMLITGKGQRVTVTMALPPNLMVEQLEAKAAELAAIKVKAAQIGVQAHKQWKSTHSVSATPSAPPEEQDTQSSVDPALRPPGEQLQAILEDVQQQLQAAMAGAHNAQGVAEQCLARLGSHPPKAWWLQGLSTAHTDLVIWAEDMANGEATLSPRAVSPAPFPADLEEAAIRTAVELDIQGAAEPAPEPELEPEPEPELEVGVEAEEAAAAAAPAEKRLPIMTVEEQVIVAAQEAPEPSEDADVPADDDATAQPAVADSADDDAEPAAEEEASAEAADGDASAPAPARLANGEMASFEASAEPPASATAAEFQEVLQTSGAQAGSRGAGRRSRISDATLRRRREFAARRQRELSSDTGPNDYSSVGISALRDPDVAQLVGEAIERDRMVDEMRHRKPVYRDMYSRRGRRGGGGRGAAETMLLPIHLPAQQPSLRDGLDVARAPRAWTLSRPHSREGVHAQAERGAHLLVNIPRPNSRASIGVGSDCTHWGHNDYLAIQESQRNREFAFNAESVVDASLAYDIEDGLRPSTPLPSFASRPSSPAGFGKPSISLLLLFFATTH